MQMAMRGARFRWLQPDAANLPGGVGTGHAAFGILFQVIGSARGADAFSFYVLSQLLIGAVGGVIYLRFKSRGTDLAPP